MKDHRARGRVGLIGTRARKGFVAWLVVAAIAGALAAAAVAAGHASGPPGSGGGGITGTTTTVTTPTTTTTTPTTTTTTTPTTPTTTTPTTTPTPAPPVVSPGSGADPFATRGMWIWILDSSDGGDLPEIIAQAKAYGIQTLMIKSGDGTSMWSQFNPSMVTELHEAGLRVCAWQFVYGNHPIIEAQVGAQAVKDGADCLLIDAEGQYQGKYVQAQSYVKKLRSLIGASFPVALAGFPYVDYHPGFPYSVFLGPGGAQYNAPQMYWRDIGTTVDDVYAHTYAFNELYQRPIDPLGQVYGSPPTAQVRRFRALSRYYGAKGISWWDWQEASTQDFKAVAQPVGSIPGFVAQTTVASLGQGAVGDVVVWAQEHLVSAGQSITIDGDFGPDTAAAVESFQSDHGLIPSGVIDATTWSLLLRYQPAAVTWTSKKGKLKATVTRSGRRGLGLTLPVPSSASRPEKRNELAGAGGAGRPSRPR